MHRFRAERKARLLHPKIRADSVECMVHSFPFAAVLFDLDGVILDTTALHYSVWEDFGRARGHAPSHGELVATNGVRASETVRLWLGQAVDDAEVEAITAELVARITEGLRSAALPPIPGVQAYVARLRGAGIPCAVATSATPENARLSLACVQLENAFGAVVSAADVTRGKPDPEPYLKAAAALGVAASCCIVVEDSVSGLRAAKAAGAKCVALTTTFPREVLAAEKPDWMCADFMSLPAEVSL